MGRKFKIFLSHSSLDYDLVKEIKDALESIGIDAFLAHRDITPSREWESEILKNLYACDLFMPILTENFKGSNWTDQEVGIAYAKKKPFLSVMLNESPYGFMGKWQGFRLDISELKRKYSIFTLLKHMVKHFPKEIRETIFLSLEGIENYEGANNAFEFLDDFHPFNESEINMIIKGSINNNNIINGFKSKPLLSEWCKKYKKSIYMSNYRKIMFILEPSKEYSKIALKLSNKMKKSFDEINEIVDARIEIHNGMISKEGVIKIIASEQGIELSSKEID